MWLPLALPWHYFFAKKGTRYTIWTWFLTLKKSWPTLSAWIWLTCAHFDLFLHQNIFENIFHDRQSVLIFLLDAWRFFHELVLISSKKWMQPDLSCGSLIFLFHTRVDHTVIFFMQEETNSKESRTIGRMLCRQGRSRESDGTIYLYYIKLPMLFVVCSG